MKMNNIFRKKCETCGCVIARGEEQRVEQPSGDTFYCKEHKKPYDKIVFFMYPGGIGYRANNVPVDEDGTPVGYVKKEGVFEIDVDTISDNIKGVSVKITKSPIKKKKTK